MILLPLNENAATGAERARRPALVERPERLGRVLEDRDAEAPADLEDRIHVGALAVEMDDDDGLRQPFALAARRAPPRARGIEVPAAALAVEEYRARAEVDDRIDARHEGERRAEDLVARADAEQPQPEVHRRGAARERDRGPPDAARELGLERVDVRPDGREPVRRERFAHVPLFGAAHMRNREVESRLVYSATRRLVARAGTPTTVMRAGTCPVTTAPAPTITSSSMRTFGRIAAPTHERAPTQGDSSTEGRIRADEAEVAEVAVVLDHRASVDDAADPDRRTRVHDRARHDHRTRGDCRGRGDDGARMTQGRDREPQRNHSLVAPPPINVVANAESDRKRRPAGDSWRIPRASSPAIEQRASRSVVDEAVDVYFGRPGDIRDDSPVAAASEYEERAHRYAPGEIATRWATFATTFAVPRTPASSRGLRAQSPREERRSSAS